MGADRSRTITATSHLLDRAAGDGLRFVTVDAWDRAAASVSTTSDGGLRISHSKAVHVRVPAGTKG